MAKRSLEKFDPLFEKVTRHLISLIQQRRLTPDALMTVPCSTTGQAMNLTMQLRQYWNALAAAQLPEYDPRCALQDMCPMLACRIAADGTTVELLHRSQLKTALHIAGALGALGQALGGSEAELTALAPPIPAEPVLPLPRAAEGGARPGPGRAQDALVEALYPPGAEPLGLAPGPGPGFGPEK